MKTICFCSFQVFAYLLFAIPLLFTVAPNLKEPLSNMGLSLVLSDSYGNKPVLFCDFFDKTERSGQSANEGAKRRV
jgi:hypothetical protein